MEKLKELEAAEKALVTMRSGLFIIRKVYKATNGGIEPWEQKKLDILTAEVAKARASLAKKTKEYLALFNDTNLTVDSKKVKVTKFGATTNGTKVILTPTKPNGKTIYFFFGYTLNSKKDMRMRDGELSDLEDDVVDAANRGFKVVYDKSGTSSEFEAALYDSKCYGIYWSGHGSNGTIQTSDGQVMSPTNFDKSKIGGNIQFLILAACQSGKNKKNWENLIKGKAADIEVEGWVKNTNIDETTDFTSEAFIDSYYSHKGTNPEKELDDYIDKAEKAK